MEKENSNPLKVRLSSNKIKVEDKEWVIEEVIFEKGKFYVLISESKKLKNIIFGSRKS